MEARIAGGGMKMKDRKNVFLKTFDRYVCMKPQNAYLTVYLTLCLAVILSLFLALIDGARRNGARLEAEIVTDIGLQSIMAEYHRELMKQYNLFAIDTSYGTDLCSKGNTEAHLQKYLTKNLSVDDVFLSGVLYRDFFGLRLEQAEIKKASVMTDGAGAVFRRCAAEAVKADLGIGLLEELRGWMQTIEVNGLEEGKEEKQKQEYDEKIDGWVSEYDGTEVEIQEGEWETVELKNPTDSLEEKKRLGILRLVTDNEAELSGNTLSLETLIQSRMGKGEINRGNMEYAEQTEAEQLLEKFAFQEYLLRYMGRYGKENEEDALRYQIEYLIAGKGSDIENLRGVANRLCVLREAANAMYLMADKEKRAEIKVAAVLVCTLVMLPELTPLLEGAILLAWAYAESVYDVRTLFAGGKVPLLKNKETWHYSLTAALHGDLKDRAQEGKGLDYQDYLRIFMMTVNTDTLTARAMDMVEADIRKTSGNSAFRLDGCYEAVEACIRIGSSYGYQYELTRQKSYH